MNLKSDSIELVADLGDKAVGLLTGIPILGECVKLAKVALGIREYLFLSKIQLFLKEANNVSAEQSVNFTKKLTGNPKFQKETGELVTFSIERADSRIKAAIIGKLFSHFIKNELDLPQLKRLLFAIDRAFLEDLLLLPAYSNKGNPYLELTNLEGTGLVRAIFPSGAWKDASDTPSTGISPLGELYSKLMADFDPNQVE